METKTRTVDIQGRRFRFERSEGTYPWAETASIAAIKSRIKRDRADWQLFSSIFKQLADPFSTGEPSDQWWELFRKQGNEVATVSTSPTPPSTTRGLGVTSTATALPVRRAVYLQSAR